MKKFKVALVALCMAMFFSSNVNAQDYYYQGDVEVGYKIGKLLGVSYNTVSITTSQGIRLNDYFYAGIGLGLDLAHSPGYEGLDIFIPIGVNLMAYYPISETISSFIYKALSYGIYTGDDIPGGFNFGIGAGVEFSMFRVSLGYGMQKVSSQGISIGQNAFEIKLGLVF